jgi:hypothetical protein
VLVYNLKGSQPAADGPPTSNTQRNGSRGSRNELTPAQELDVRLEALTASRPDPQAAERNPFRFRPAPPPPEPATPPPLPDPGPVAAPEPQGPPPIPLKFIGIVESPRAGKIAALTDGKVVMYGREGDTIEGRYRIVRIGAESITMEHWNGREGQGRQTIRLSGQ